MIELIALSLSGVAASAAIVGVLLVLLESRDRVRRDKPEVTTNSNYFGAPKHVTFLLHNANTTFDWKISKIQVNRPHRIKCIALLSDEDDPVLDWHNAIDYPSPVGSGAFMIHPAYSEVLLTFVCRRTTWMWWEKKKLEPVGIIFRH